MIDPEEIMKKYKFFPDADDITAACASAEKYLELVNERNLDMGTVDIFYAAFYRGAYWMKNKLEQEGKGKC